ncbi:MAG: serine protease [Chitinophagaceae bacterium]|nr:serine protease [Chitinophagaceae bacterium]
MKLSKIPTFHKHKLTDSPIYEVTVRIVALSKDCREVLASGTGVVIAQNLILTAKHVLEDFIGKWETRKVDGEIIVESFNIWVIFISSDSGSLYHVFEVARCYLNPYSDQVLFHLDPRDKVGNLKDWKQVRLSLRLPKIGERVVCFGFSKSNINITKNKKVETDIHVYDEPHTSVGEIIEVFPEKRDSYRLNFPSARINARLDGGMSGGPVFNDTGNLIGIVCSGFNQADSAEHISYISLLWPLMATPIIQDDGSSYPLYNLAKEAIIGVDTIENIVLSKNTSNQFYKISYKR